MHIVQKDVSATAIATGPFRMANLGRTITAWVPPEGPKMSNDPRTTSIETSTPIIPHSRGDRRRPFEASPISLFSRLFSLDIRLTHLSVCREAGGLSQR